MTKGEDLRDAGMEASLLNAENKSPDWQYNALKLLIEFIEESPQQAFQAEDVRKWAYKKGLPNPPHNRAWGAVMVTARRHKIIEPIGYKNVKNPSAHATPATLWRRAGTNKACC